MLSRGRFPTLRHNKVRNIIACLLKQVAHLFRWYSIFSVSPVRSSDAALPNAKATRILAPGCRRGGGGSSRSDEQVKRNIVLFMHAYSTLTCPRVVPPRLLLLVTYMYRMTVRRSVLARHGFSTRRSVLARHGFSTQWHGFSTRWHGFSTRCAYCL